MSVRNRRIAEIPDFDDPFFDFKLNTGEVPLTERKWLFVGLWETFDHATKTRFISRVTTGGSE